MSSKNPFADPSVTAAATSNSVSPPASMSKIEINMNLSSPHPQQTIPSLAPTNISPYDNPNTPSKSTLATGGSEEGSGMYTATPGPQPGIYSNPPPNLMEEVGNSIKATEKSAILKVMRCINILLAALNIFTGVFSWLNGYTSSFQKIIASIYVVIFGALLLGFELRWEKVDSKIRQLFGFMYGYKTRTIFLIFVAIWPLSIGTHPLTVIASLLMFLNAFFNLFVVYNHPAFFSGVSQEQANNQNKIGQNT